MTRQPRARHAPTLTSSRTPASHRRRPFTGPRALYRPPVATVPRSPAVTVGPGRTVTVPRPPTPLSLTTRPLTTRPPTRPGPAPARYRGAGLALILVASFMVVLDEKGTCVKVGGKLTKGA